MNYLDLSLGFILCVFCLHAYLDVRQLRAIKKRDPPESLKGSFTDEQYKQAQAYSIDKWWFGFWQGLYSTAETCAALWCGFLPWIWTQLAAVPWLARHGEICVSIAFVFVLAVASTLTSLPWSLYSTFVIEERHGFNKQTLRLFLADLAKSLVLGAVLIMPPLIAGATWILMHSGPWMPIYLWGFTFAVSLFFLTIYPTVIAPLYNKFEPLPDGSLRSAIEELASGLKFPLKKLYSMDGSKRSSHSNAYFTGIFEKRIVLFDSLIEQCSQEQVVAVLAHELGHWKLRHTSISFAMGNVITLANFLLLAALRSAPGLYEAFGFTQERPAFIALVLFQILVAPMDEVIGFFMNLVSRAFEFQADGFAVRLGKGRDLQAALLKLQETNKTSLSYDSLYSVYHHSHPHITERLAAIDAAMKTKAA